MNHFATLDRPVEVAGVGLHSGRAVRLILQPSARAGVRFARVDLPGAPEIEADWRRVTSTTHATTLEMSYETGAVAGAEANTEPAQVMTTEHLLAALWASGITHCRVEMDAPEVPILDGSARPWCEAIARAGTRLLQEPRPFWSLRAPVWIQQGDAHVLGLPLPDATEVPTFRLSVAVGFDACGARAQVFDGLVAPASFAAEIAPARTFTLEAWLEPLRAAGLIRGGSLDNAILIGESGWSSPPRTENELARHKALDVVGDLALLFGVAGFHGHIIATRAGHGAHRHWMEECRRRNALHPIESNRSPNLVKMDV